MRNLFNDGWEFCEIPLENDSMFNGKEPVLFTPDQFFDTAAGLQYKSIKVPHDWQISHAKDLYRNSVGCYKKNFTLEQGEIRDHHLALKFEGVYMNSAVWVNGKKAGEWKYGYSTFEFDITHLVQIGENTVQVIAVYQNPNTRWYSGAGIFRDVTLINTRKTFLASDGTYFVSKPVDSKMLDKEWTITISTEVAGYLSGHKVINTITDKDGNIFTKSHFPVSPLPVTEDEIEYLHKNIPALSFNTISKSSEELTVSNPHLWDVKDPYLYTLTTELFDAENNLIDSYSQNCGFKYAEFTTDQGFFLNGRHLKINGACQHHDHGALGSAFDINAQRRQFLKLKEMGVNSVRCSHNPPPKAWMDLADELGLMIDDEAFDMWEKPKTTFDYGNYFNEWHEKDTVSWIRKDRNHPSLIMWSIGNEIYDTHMGNGYEITKTLYKIVERHDPLKNAPITIASNYMMTEGAQHCGEEIDTVGYNYLERLYDEHHNKYKDWKIYGSETGSTVQSRGIYHFPESLKLVTFSDGQCSTLGNCTAPWGAANTQTLITGDRDIPYSAGQYIWTGWDYIGEPTPYHTKNSYFGQIDTAGFPKDTFWLYKSEWAGKDAEPFVHLLPYWDWNEGQLIDVKAYSNASAVELFFNGESLGRQEIDHVKSKEPLGRWQLEYRKGELKAVAYDESGNIVAEEIKRSFGDPAKIILEPETYNTGDLFFIDIMTADKDGTLVENARNYITFNVTGNAELIGMDNGDSTDYDEYTPANGKSLSRKLFANRLVAVVRMNKGAAAKGGFVITAASKDLPTVSLKYDGTKWIEAAPYLAIRPEMDFVPTRKIEIIAEGSPKMNKDNREIKVTCKVLPENASIKEINWNPVLKECVPSDFIEVTDLQGAGTGTETAVIKAVCDGDCILRCTARNGGELDEVLSDLNFSVTEVGNPKLNPYKLIEGCRHDLWDKTRNRAPVCLEGGISNREAAGLGPTWVGFTKVDFGTEGADTIHIPIFSFETELPVEVWDGTPGDGTTYEGTKPSTTGGECLGKFTYKHESIYNTYNENVFTLSKRLFGVHTISIAIPHELYLQGFYFDQTPKATAKLRALDADVVSGDTFTKTTDGVEGIGNNVSLDFGNMDFGEIEATKVTICGKSNTENNSINIKFFGADGKNSTQLIEFAHTDDYEEKTFDISPVSGAQKISFVFLPGCNFDFKWFRFN